MGPKQRPAGAAGIYLGLIGVAGLAVTALMLGAVGPFPDDAAGQSVQAEGLALDVPVGRATADLASPVLRPGGDVRTAWTRLPRGGQRQTPTMLYDNGLPLEDFGQPASQLSLCSDECANPDPADLIPCNDIVGDATCLLSGMIRQEFFGFNAASADDFVLQDATSPDTDFQITTIRAAFVFFFQGADTADPMTTWFGGIEVTVFANSVLNAPDGVPNGDGTSAGQVIATQLVPAASLTQTLAGSCLPCWVVDIPVSFVLAKNTRYWLSLVPQHPAPPQSFWCLSELNTGFVAHRGADVSPAFWTEILGNENSSGCTDPAPPMALIDRDLSFQILGEQLPQTMIACCDTTTGVCRDVVAPAGCTGAEVTMPGVDCMVSGCRVVTGACCDDTMPAGCMDNVNVADCPGPNERFTPDVSCADLDPQCGTTAMGACCFADQTCTDLDPTDCSNMGGTWNAGTCAAFACPSANDDCDSAVLLSSGSILFDTRGASTDGPAVPLDPNCTDVNQDIWFRYLATCDGQAFISLCLDTNYDAALAVYDGCACGTSLGPQLACNDDFCGVGGAAALSAPVRKGNCYLIRVGGAGNAVGTGTLTVFCVPDLTCCIGDANDDGVLDAADVPAMIAALLSPPSAGTLALCQTDVNGDGVVDGLDIQPFVDQLIGPTDCASMIITGACCLADQTCVQDTVDGCFLSGGIYQGNGTACTTGLCQPPNIVCCRGDLNGDAVIDAADLPLMIAALLNPPPMGTVAFCEADVNQDGVVDGDDIQRFVDRLIGGVSCTPPVTGACCLADGGCRQDTQAACMTAGGTYQGDNTVCTPNLCPQPLVIECCPGNFNSDGVVDTLDAAGFINAVLNPPPPDTPSFCRGDINQDTFVDGRDIDGFVTLVLNQEPCPAPANDNCDNARLLSCNVLIAVDNSQATTDPSDPVFSCHFAGAAQGTGTLWFAFVAIDTTAYVSTCGSFPPASDTILAVYDAQCPTVGNEIACNEDSCGRLSELCVTGLTTGQTYYVQVASSDMNTLGFIAMQIVCPCP